MAEYATLLGVLIIAIVLIFGAFSVGDQQRSCRTISPPSSPACSTRTRAASFNDRAVRADGIDVSTHDEAPRRPSPLAGLARVADRAIPNPLLALPLLLLALGLLVYAPVRITGDTFFDLVAGRDIVQHGLPHTDRLMAFTARPLLAGPAVARAPPELRPVLARRAAARRARRHRRACSARSRIAMLAARALGGSPTWIAAVASPVMLLLVPSTARAQTFAMPLFAAPDLAARTRRADAGPTHLADRSAARAVGEPARERAARRARSCCSAAPSASASPLRARSARDLRAAARLWPRSQCSRRSPRPTGPSSSPTTPAPRRTAPSTRWSPSGRARRCAHGRPSSCSRRVAVVAILRPEIRLGLFDKLCLGALVLAGLDTTRNIVWLPIAATVLLPRALTEWSPADADALAPATAAHAGRARRRDRRSASSRRA